MCAAQHVRPAKETPQYFCMIFKKGRIFAKTKKVKDMETVLIELTNQRAIALLRELEELNILKILKQTKLPKAVKSQNLADRFAGKLDAANAASFHQQLKESRQEWERTF